MVFGWGRGGSAASALATGGGVSTAGPQERAVIADAAGVAPTFDSLPSDIGSGSSAAGLDAAVGADDVSWAPLPAAGGGGAGAKGTGPKEPQPYRFQSHAVKAHLKVRDGEDQGVSSARAGKSIGARCVRVADVSSFVGTCARMVGPMLANASLRQPSPPNKHATPRRLPFLPPLDPILCYCPPPLLSSSRLSPSLA